MYELELRGTSGYWGGHRVELLEGVSVSDPGTWGYTYHTPVRSARPHLGLEEQVTARHFGPSIDYFTASKLILIAPLHTNISKSPTWAQVEITAHANTVKPIPRPISVRRFRFRTP